MAWLSKCSAWRAYEWNKTSGGQIRVIPPGSLRKRAVFLHPSRWREGQDQQFHSPSTILLLFGLWIIQVQVTRVINSAITPFSAINFAVGLQFQRYLEVICFNFQRPQEAEERLSHGMAFRFGKEPADSILRRMPDP